MADAVLGRAAQLWALLDDMAERDPRAYRRLLRQQRAQAQRFLAPAEPRLCLRALPADGAPLFVNVCAWGRVPAPERPPRRVPVVAGPLEEVAAGGDVYSVIDVAYNPAVLQGAEESPEQMEHVLHLTLTFVEQRCGRALSRSYTVEPFQLKGSPEGMRQRLEGRRLPSAHPAQHPQSELTLDQLLHGMEAEERSDAPVLLEEESITHPTAHLIEEISSTEVPEELSTPAYEMTTVRDANNKPVRIELKVGLPKVSSVSECDLRISKDDMIIDVPEKYKLQLDLPELVDEETTTAVLNKGKGVLCITVSVANPGQ